MAAGRKLRVWHRRLGIVAAGFTIVLAVTGLLLNHEPRLNMNKIMVSHAWVLSWYGIGGLSEETKGYELEGAWLLIMENQAYLGHKALSAISTALVGAISVPDMIVVADAHQLSLLTQEGDLIERFAPSGVKGAITSLGKMDDRAYLQTDLGLFESDVSLEKWEMADREDIQWSRAVILPPSVSAELTGELTAEMIGGGLPLYRIVLDLHSGRILSAPGRLAMDGAALVLIILSVTGLWIWWPRR